MFSSNIAKGKGKHRDGTYISEVVYNPFLEEIRAQ